MDHRPLPMVEAPLVSAIAGTENMIETAGLLVPGLQAVRIDQLTFLDAIPVPTGAQVETRCLGELKGSTGMTPVVSASVEGRDEDGNWTPRFAGMLYLAGTSPPFPS